MKTVENLLRALEAAESTLRRIAAKNEQIAEITLALLKEEGANVMRWPGGYFEDIAEAALGRASICREAIATKHTKENENSSVNPINK